MLIFITGGAKSGKSDFALELAEKSEGRRLFLATAESLDEEMEQRIQKHRQQRGNCWDTIEEPLYLGRALRPVLDRYETILADCLTLWMSNLLGRYPEQEAETDEIIGDFFSCVGEFKGTMIVVSNEVGMGIVPDNKPARIYSERLGLLNRMTAWRAERVYLLFSGIPVELKGNKDKL